MKLWLAACFLFSRDCSDDVAMSYLEIFEDDVESAVAAYLASDDQEMQQDSSQLSESPKSSEAPVFQTHNNSFTFECLAANEGMCM